MRKPSGMSWGGVRNEPKQDDVFFLREAEKLVVGLCKLVETVEQRTFCCSSFPQFAWPVLGLGVRGKG